MNISSDAAVTTRMLEPIDHRKYMVTRMAHVEQLIGIKPSGWHWPGLSDSSHVRCTHNQQSAAIRLLQRTITLPAAHVHQHTTFLRLPSYGTLLLLMLLGKLLLPALRLLPPLPGILFSPQLLLHCCLPLLPLLLRPAPLLPPVVHVRLQQRINASACRSQQAVTALIAKPHCQLTHCPQCSAAAALLL
jgi:hypothetical protein